MFFVCLFMLTYVHVCFLYVESTLMTYVLYMFTYGFSSTFWCVTWWWWCAGSSECWAALRTRHVLQSEGMHVGHVGYVGTSKSVKVQVQTHGQLSELTCSGRRTRHMAVWHLCLHSLNLAWQGVWADHSTTPNTGPGIAVIPTGSSVQLCTPRWRHTLSGWSWQQKLTANGCASPLTWMWDFDGKIPPSKSEVSPKKPSMRTPRVPQVPLVESESASTLPLQLGRPLASTSAWQTIAGWDGGSWSGVACQTHLNREKP